MNYYNTQRPCPTCGTCPTCGRHASPYWQQPYTWSGLGSAGGIGNADLDSYRNVPNISKSVVTTGYIREMK